jgi:hypothetical protein
MFTREITNRSVADFKVAFNEALAFGEEKQETLAMRIGVTQAQINNWLNPHSDRNFPMALFPLLPVRMQTFLMSHLDKVLDNRNIFKGLNGDINDEIVDMLVLEGELKKQTMSEPHKAKATIVKMEQMLKRMQAEVDQMNESR